jgi:hypothetical protein
LLAAAGAAMFLAWRERVAAAVIALAGGGLLLVQLAMTGHQALAPSFSTAHLVGLIKPRLTPDSAFYSVRMYEQTLPFYIKRTVSLVDYDDELGFGIEQEPQLEIPTIEEFEARWRRDHKPLAVMGPDMYRKFSARGLPMTLLYQDARRVIVAKP